MGVNCDLFCAHNPFIFYFNYIFFLYHRTITIYRYITTFPGYNYDSYNVPISIFVHLLHRNLQSRLTGTSYHLVWSLKHKEKLARSLEFLFQLLSQNHVFEFLLRPLNYIFSKFIDSSGCVYIGTNY